MDAVSIWTYNPCFKSQRRSFWDDGTYTLICDKDKTLAFGRVCSEPQSYTFIILSLEILVKELYF